MIYLALYVFAPNDLKYKVQRVDLCRVELHE